MALTHSRCGGGVRSYTAPGAHSTAAAIGKQYHDEFPPSSNPDKRADRTDDGTLSSGAYARRSGAEADRVTARVIQLEYHHPLERWLGNRLGRWFLRKLSAAGPDGQTALQRIVATYRDGCSPWPVRASTRKGSPAASGA